MKYLILALLLFTTDAQANSVQLKLGGWSHHINTSYKYNESHNGFGLAYEVNKSVLGFSGYSFEVWRMKDSLFQSQIQLSATLFKRFNVELPMIKAIDFNLSAGVMRRGMSWKYYKDDTFYGVNKKTFAYALPSITWHFNNSSHIDIVYIPDVKGISPDKTIFFRYGFSF